MCTTSFKIKIKKNINILKIFLLYTLYTACGPYVANKYSLFYV